jgi:hypothetical protein
MTPDYFDDHEFPTILSAARARSWPGIMVARSLNSKSRPITSIARRLPTSRRRSGTSPCACKDPKYLARWPFDFTIRPYREGTETEFMRGCCDMIFYGLWPAARGDIVNWWLTDCDAFCDFVHGGADQFSRVISNPDGCTQFRNFDREMPTAVIACAKPAPLRAAGCREEVDSNIAFDEVLHQARRSRAPAWAPYVPYRRDP